MTDREWWTKLLEIKARARRARSRAVVWATAAILTAAGACTAMAVRAPLIVSATAVVSCGPAKRKRGAVNPRHDFVADGIAVSLDGPLAKILVEKHKQEIKETIEANVALVRQVLGREPNQTHVVVYKNGLDVWGKWNAIQLSSGTRPTLWGWGGTNNMRLLAYRHRGTVHISVGARRQFSGWLTHQLLHRALPNGGDPQHQGPDWYTWDLLARQTDYALYAVRI